MRLINVKTFLDKVEKLDKERSDKEKPDEEKPLFYTPKKNELVRYAILSHRWLEYEKTGRKEILFKDLEDRPFEDLLGDPILQDSVSKIKGTCFKALQHGLEYVWIDNCCINKTDPAEVSKSVRSMFEWYKMAIVCFAYLSDVTCSVEYILRSEEDLRFEKEFKNSEWFTRGWTLQELLAPKEMKFFETVWRPIGMRKDLSKLIKAKTGIETDYLNDFEKFSQEASVAKKISWVSGRETKEEEDKAYCLFGILNVSIDVRYGEGSRAFLRLQEELIKHSHDESLFVWQSDKLKTSGFLAPSPECFKNSGTVQLRPEKYRARGAYELNNQGLHFPAPATIVGASTVNPYPYRRWRIEKGKIVQLPLYCWIKKPEGWRAINIYLGIVNGKWQRVRCHDLEFSEKVKYKSRGDLNLQFATEYIDIPQLFTYKSESG